MFTIELLKEKLVHETSELLGTFVDPEWIEVSNPKAGSHLALPCFRFSKEAGKSPNEIADRIALTLKLDELEKVEAQGPYVNFWIKSEALVDGVQSSRHDVLNNKPSNNKTAIVEFLSPNLAKPLSIGHFRNALQGRAAALFYRNAGYRVVTDNHIGDWGTVFGMWVAGFRQFGNEEKLAVGGVEELGRIYVMMRKALKEEADRGESELAGEVQEWLLKLEDNDPEAWDYHRKFSEISLRSVTEQMEELDIVFDENLGESFYIERGKQMVGELVASGDAVKNDDGSIVVPLDGQGIDTPMIIEKSNGAALYHTSDIATIEYRERTWNPDLVIYVVGMEQKFHFEQLFAANKKVGWSDAELVHHWYGLIEELDEDGSRQKMSSRKNAIYMRELLELAHKRAKEAAKEDISDEDITIIAHGALTFQEFSASHTGNTLFDWDSMFSLTGYSGPYVQYAGVRIASLSEKADEEVKAPPMGYDLSEQADILWLLNRFESIVEQATEQREYHKVATFAYDLARAWNRLYEEAPILAAEGDERQARLWLAQTIGAYLERALNLLGMKIPSKM